jgi:hypothetical protein
VLLENSKGKIGGDRHIGNPFDEKEEEDGEGEKKMAASDDGDSSSALTVEEHDRILKRLSVERPALTLIGGDKRMGRREMKSPSHVLRSRRDDVETGDPIAAKVHVDHRAQFQMAHQKQHTKAVSDANRRLTVAASNERALRDEHKRQVAAGYVETKEEKAARRKRMRALRRARMAEIKRIKKERKLLNHSIKSEIEYMDIPWSTAGDLKRVYEIGDVAVAIYIRQKNELIAIKAATRLQTQFRARKAAGRLLNLRKHGAGGMRKIGTAKKSKHQLRKMY